MVIGGKRLDSLTDRVHPEIEPVEKGAVDDDGCHAGLAIGLGKPAPCEHRYRQRFEEAGAGPWISAKYSRVAFDSRSGDRNDPPRKPNVPSGIGEEPTATTPGCDSSASTVRA